MKAENAWKTRSASGRKRKVRALPFSSEPTRQPPTLRLQAAYPLNYIVSLCSDSRNLKERHNGCACGAAPCHHDAPVTPPPPPSPPPPPPPSRLPHHHRKSLHTQTFFRDAPLINFRDLRRCLQNFPVKSLLTEISPVPKLGQSLFYWDAVKKLIRSNNSHNAITVALSKFSFFYLEQPAFA